jgi:TusA-related sulfurtransferase
MAEPNKTPVGPAPVKLRSREELEKARKSEIIRAMRDASEAKQVIPAEWVSELAQLVDVDIRRR